MPKQPFRKKLGRREAWMENLFYRPSTTEPGQMELSVPRFLFSTPYRWQDTGSSTWLANGTNLEDGSRVLAKIAESHDSASVVIERESYILGRLHQNLEASTKTMRLVDYFIISPSQTSRSAVVLILRYPGPNVLSTFYPPFDAPAFLHATDPNSSASSSASTTSGLRSRDEAGDELMSEEERAKVFGRDLATSPDDEDRGHRSLGVGDEDALGDMERGEMMVDEDDSFASIDIASFLEFAYQATHCVEILHAASITHREIRPNAFHWNSSNGQVRWAHFGNRSVSLEGLGGPSGLVMAAEELGEKDRKRVKEALNFLSPEQTGRVQFVSDNRTDLYCLGVTFWTLLTGKMPFNGASTEIFAAICSTPPPLITAVRPDVPPVLSAIISKLLAKNPDERYRTPAGLKADLLICQSKLTEGWSGRKSSVELIPSFPIASQDKFSEFVLPNTLFGRATELETIRSVIRRVASTHSLHYSGRRSLFPNSSAGSQIYSTTLGGNTTANGGYVTAGAQTVDSGSSTRSSHPSQSGAAPSPAGASGLPVLASGGVGRLRAEAAEDPTIAEEGPGGTGSSEVGSSGKVSSTGSSGARMRSHGNAREKLVTARAVVIIGQGGSGKSSMVQEVQNQIRQAGFYGVAKFEAGESSPYSAILTSLSFVFHQMITEFQSDIVRFVQNLRSALGPQLPNVQLLYHSVPELKDLMRLFGLTEFPPTEPLPTAESRARFHNLVLDVIGTLAGIRMLTMCFDDLQFADQPSLSLIRSIAQAKIRMLLITTLRPDNEQLLSRTRQMFGTGSRATYISVAPLSPEAVTDMVSGTLHQPPEDVTSLVNVLYRHAKGNAFSTRNLLVALRRHNHIYFDWSKNQWHYNLETIETTFFKDIGADRADDEGDISFLINHLADLQAEVQRFLIWAALYGGVFPVRSIIELMNSEDDTSGSEDSDAEEHRKLTRRSMEGFQVALAEGWIVARGRECCSFTHDRYRQAATKLAKELPNEEFQIMALKIVDLLLRDKSPDVFQVAEHIRRCIPVLKMRENFKYRELLQRAADVALSQGAHETALRYVQVTVELLPLDAWKAEPRGTFDLHLRLSELLIWKGDLEPSSEVLKSLKSRAIKPFDQASIFRAEANICWVKNEMAYGLDLLLSALHVLGVEISASVTVEEADQMYEETKVEIEKLGTDRIKALPAATDPAIILACSILSDSTTTAYWANGGGLTDAVSIKLVNLSLKYGMSPSSSLGFMFVASSAEKKDSFALSVQLGRLACHLANLHSGPTELGRVTLLYGALGGACWDGSDIKDYAPKFELSTKYSLAAGDRTYSSFGHVHKLAHHFISSTHLSDSLIACEESVDLIDEWGVETGVAWMARGTAGCLRALAGRTLNASPETVLDSETFSKAEQSHLSTGRPLSENFYNCFELVALYSLGHHQAAADLGFKIWESKTWSSNHHHTRMAFHYFSLAMIEVLRSPSSTPATQSLYLTQVEANQAFIGRWLVPGPINVRHWLLLVEAEVASLNNDPSSFQKYDEAIKACQDGSWICDEAWAFFLSGSHFVRVGVVQLGAELQNRAVVRHGHWGAFGVSAYLSGRSRVLLEKPRTHLADAGVQTDHTHTTTMPSLPMSRPTLNSFLSDPTGSEDQALDLSNLTVDDLTAIITSSRLISSDVNLSATLESLTEIVCSHVGADHATIVVKAEGGELEIATTLSHPGDAVQVFDKPIPVSEHPDVLSRTIINHVLNSRETLFMSNVSTDPRFATIAHGPESPGKKTFKSILCLPIQSKGIIIGAIHLASCRTNAFTPSNVTVLTILAQQASISINNAQLFRKLHWATRENIRYIDQQKRALEEARRSKEEALKATKIKSNFLASMSHELRTPFSSFFGLLSLLSETPLNREQADFVSTARGSCEVLLDIINSLLDYSKLEAGAVKLELLKFSTEELIGDSVELLQTMAKKNGILLSYVVEEDVPNIVVSDPSRLRQILVNIISNGLKFTSQGRVTVRCSVDLTASIECAQDETVLKYEVIDTGIGISEQEQTLLFMPFSQVDGSTTRKYGGTGLGLSICLQLAQLLGGSIRVESEVGKGSNFQWLVPVKIDAGASVKVVEETIRLRTALNSPSPPVILVYSPSPATTSMVVTTLAGSSVSSHPSIADVQATIKTDSPPTFIIVDTSDETEIEDLRRVCEACVVWPKIIQVLVPTAETVRTRSHSGPGVEVVRSLHPLRRTKLLQLLVDLRSGEEVNTPALKAAPTSVRTLDKFTDEEKEHFKSCHILIAEDNTVAAKLLIKTLERLGLSVTAAVNGEEAVNAWDAQQPGFFSLALFDHHMPIKDGPSAASRIRMLEAKNRIRERLPIVGLSADCQSSAKRLCISSGMQDYTNKPLRQNELIKLLRTYVLPRGGLKAASAFVSTSNGMALPSPALSLMPPNSESTSTSTSGSLPRRLPA